MGWAGLPAQARAGLHLPDRLLDRLIGGRAWIAVIAFALIGIVGMQLWVVKLGVGIGRAVEHTQLLQQENSALSAEDSALSSGERIERLALGKGMVPASPAALHFDTVRGPLDARLAAAALAKPIQAPTSTAPETPAVQAPTPAVTEAAPSATGGSTEAASAPIAAGGSTEAASAPTVAGGSTEAASAPTVAGGSTEAASTPTAAGGGTQAAAGG